jgi:pimeloyl-ACP methyl ester carboxylesterase
MPVLVANGIADVMAPAEHSFAIAQKAPWAKLLLYPDAGHAFLFQYAEDFCAEMLRFTATLAATSIKDTRIEDFATGRSSGTRQT